MPRTHPSPPIAQVAARPIGAMLVLIAASMAACGLVGLAMGDRADAAGVFQSALVAAGVGGLLAWWGSRIRPRIGRRDALFIVVAAWFASGIFGALPFVFSAGMSPVDAFFETVSGFTTTGATILGDIEGTLGPATHLWRTATHWLGGLGIVVLFVALFPALGVGGKHLFQTEAPGPPSGGLLPRIRDTARVLWKVYLAITLAEVGLLMIAGLSPFESVVHAFSTMGTGGFSTRNGSFGDFHNVAADVVVTVFMLFAGMNFGLFHEMTTRGWRSMWRNTELRVYLGIFALVTAIVTLDLFRFVYRGDPFSSLRYAAFQVASIMTTTGLGTADFEKWPVLSQALLVTLYFIGGCAGSTAGGIKVVRVAIIGQVLVREARRGFRPALVRPVRLGDHVVQSGVLTEVFAYGALFSASVAFGAVAVGVLEPHVDLVTAFMSSLACTANVGPGLGLVGPTDNYGFFTAATKLVLSVLMIVGRLEGFALLALFVPGFWRR